MKTITSANSIFLLSVGTLFAVQQRIEGFAADTAWAFESVSNSEVLQGVDGKMSAGWVPHLTPMTITLQPDKSGWDVFLAWHTAEESIREKIFCDGTISIPSINRRYVLSNGVLTAYDPAPSAQKVLQQMTYKITWETVVPSLI